MSNTTVVGLVSIIIDFIVACLAAVGFWTIIVYCITKAVEKERK